MFTGKKFIIAILVTGFIVGTLDALGAIIVYKANPFTMFQFIASGALGREAAFSGGNPTMIAGVLFHYLIAFSWTALFFALYRKFPFVSRHRLISGIVFGVLIWLVMNLVVLRLSKIPQGPLSLSQALVGAAILVFAVGIPLGLLTDYFFRPKNKKFAQS